MYKIYEFCRHDDGRRGLVFFFLFSQFGPKQTERNNLGYSHAEITRSRFGFLSHETRGGWVGVGNARLRFWDSRGSHVASGSRARYASLLSVTATVPFKELKGDGRVPLECRSRTTNVNRPCCSTIPFPAHVASLRQAAIHSLRAARGTMGVWE